MTFCPSCGAEKKEGSKFCHNCGYEFKAVEASASQDPISNAELNQDPISNAELNQSPNPAVQTSENSHTFAKVLGYISAILIPLIGIIIGIYLLTRNEENAKKHGKIIIGLSILVWFISYLLMYG